MKKENNKNVAYLVCEKLDCYQIMKANFPEHAFEILKYITVH